MLLPISFICLLLWKGHLRFFGRDDFISSAVLCGLLFRCHGCILLLVHLIIDEVIVKDVHDTAISWIFVKNAIDILDLVDLRVFVLDYPADFLTLEIHPFVKVRHRRLHAIIALAVYVLVWNHGRLILLLE